MTVSPTARQHLGGDAPAMPRLSALALPPSLDPPAAPRAPIRVERGKSDIIPARRAHAAFSAASECRGLKRPFQPFGFGSLFYCFREHGAESLSGIHCFVCPLTE